MPAHTCLHVTRLIKENPWPCQRESERGLCDVTRWWVSCMRRSWGADKLALLWTSEKKTLPHKPWNASTLLRVMKSFLVIFSQQEKCNSKKNKWGIKHYYYYWNGLEAWKVHTTSILWLRFAAVSCWERKNMKWNWEKKNKFKETIDSKPTIEYEVKCSVFALKNIKSH